MMLTHSINLTYFLAGHHHLFLFSDESQLQITMEYLHLLAHLTNNWTKMITEPIFLETKIK